MGIIRAATGAIGGLSLIHIFTAAGNRKTGKNCAPWYLTLYCGCVHAMPSLFRGGNKMSYQIGLDVGSTTIKVVVPVSYTHL